MESEQRWAAVDRYTHRIVWQGDRWTLRATPGQKYPWQLANGRGVHQEIGAPDLAAAKAMVEFWLEATTTFGNLPVCTSRETA